MEPLAALQAWPEEPLTGWVDCRPATAEGVDCRPGTSHGSRPRAEGGDGRPATSLGFHPMEREAPLRAPLQSIIRAADKAGTERLSPTGVHFMEADPFYDAHSGSDSDSLRRVQLSPPPLPARPPARPPTLPPPRARVSAPVVAKKLFGIFARPGEPSVKAAPLIC